MCYEEIVPVDVGPGRDAAPSYVVVPRRNDPGHRRAVVFLRVVYVSSAGIVVVEGRRYVGRQVFVVLVYAVVNDDYVDALAGNAFCPDWFDVNVFPLVVAVFQVPLAGVQVVANPRVRQSGGVHCATCDKSGVP